MYDTCTMSPSRKAPKAKTPLAKKLIALRVKHDLSQVDAAKKSGVSARTWIAWENDQRVPGNLALQLIRKAFPDLKI